jgi:uncharacterized tellurite resistance protein B-like protein
MIKRLEQFFERLINQNDNETLTRDDLQLASAALLVEVAVIDRQFDDSEYKQLQSLLISEYHLTEKEARQLIDQAREASANSGSLFEFTQKINQHGHYEQKLVLLEGMWIVAYADGNLDKYEEHIIRRIADLLHISHRDFIQVKIQVRDSKAN